ncbi:hypothetical protein B7P43_G12614 [Cryptotermes secundus]|uniref:Uncharacterized protein n=1 Tax=Cryptotermes secundus TaxID=105785 RepID=A0A2J7QKG7_9NEOP|nr:hypothetical protein B7P43_G12614 [Cryptotermes secundus]
MSVINDINIQTAVCNDAATVDPPYLLKLLSVAVQLSVTMTSVSVCSAVHHCMSIHYPIPYLYAHIIQSDI